MSRIYWLEDETELLDETLDSIRRMQDLELYTYRTLKALQNAIGQNRTLPDWVVIDLWLPLHCTPNGHTLHGVEVGLLAIEEVQRAFERSNPIGIGNRSACKHIVIVSGNISIRIREELLQKHRLLEELIFEKPLSDEEEGRLRRKLGSPPSA
jgi:hypothetical protein